MRISRFRYGVLLSAYLLAMGGVAAEPEFVERNSGLAGLAPAESFAGVGCWMIHDDRYVATGHSTSIDSLCAAKDKRTEREFAEEDAKSRIIAEAARLQEPLFDTESHNVSVETNGFQTAATYKIAGRGGLFLVGMVSKKDVHVRVSFDASKTRCNAVNAFDSGDFSRAARLLSALTQHEVQDAETTGFAHAASAHVNLAAGVTGESRTDALKMLSDFYFVRGDTEQALRFTYDLYRETETPDRMLLERLSELSSRTHRSNNAAAFCKEINQRWPSPAPR